MTTLEELLNVPRFSDLTLITKHKTLNKIVETIEISETPDVANFVPDRILLLTTAMIYQDNQQELIPLLDSLKEKKAAALGVKLGRFLETIDSDVINYANQIDFPIILIPSTQPLGALLHQLQTYLSNTKTEQLSYALDIQKRFSDLLIHDVSMTRFTANLGKLINTPVILISPWYKVIAHSKHFIQTSKPADYYIQQINQHYQNWITEKKASFIIQDLNDKPMQISGFPIKVNTYFPYYLLILNPENIPYPISEFAVDQAGIVLAFMLYKNQKVDESLKILKSDFLKQMIDSQQSTHPATRDWLGLGASYGLKESSYYQVIYVSCLPTLKTATKIKYQQEESHLASQWLHETLLVKIKHTTIFHIKNTNHLAILIQKKNDRLEEILVQLSQQLSSTLPITICFALGNPYEKIEQIANSYVEAKIAYEETLSMNDKPILHHYLPKGMRSLFEKMPAEDIHYFCQNILQELAYPTEDSMIELRKTLKFYLDFQCEISKTAAALYLHRNTIKYRINHCEKILGVRIQEPGVSLNLRLALALSQQENEILTQ